MRFGGIAIQPTTNGNQKKMRKYDEVKATNLRPKAIKATTLILSDTLPSHSSSLSISEEKLLSPFLCVSIFYRR